jgi:hypothetical protein
MKFYIVRNKDININSISVFVRYSYISLKCGFCAAVYFKCSSMVFDLLSFSGATDLDEITTVHESIQQNAPMLELTYQDM